MAPPAPAQAAPPPAARATARRQAPDTSRKAEIEELVVTGARIGSASSPEALAEQLRNAAAGGQSRQIAVLLSREVPIDAVDDQGETALMKAVQERQVEAAALLRRRGASLDLKNSAGRSARDMAAALGDPAMNKALGLDR